MSRFKDHFSGHAESYSRYRPLWPQQLFAWLAEQAPGRDLAWDCATGNGQAARALQSYFRQVFATDASAQQIAKAIRQSRVDYRVEAAEKCSLVNESADLLFVGQAFHWFDHQAFLSEAKRVLRPGGLIAISSYQLAVVTPAVDQVIRHLWGAILEAWWPPERDLVDRGLTGVKLPFSAIKVPDFEMTVEWEMSELLDYLGTWSSVQRYRQSRNADPLDLISEDLQKAWEIPQQKRKVSWPISLSVRRKPV